jgi:hypothetical protein
VYNGVDRVLFLALILVPVGSVRILLGLGLMVMRGGLVMLLAVVIDRVGVH